MLKLYNWCYIKNKFEGVDKTMSTKKRFFICYCLACYLLFIICGCSTSDKLKYGEITEKPKVNSDVISNIQSKKSENEIWKYDNLTGIDLRGIDLSDANLNDKIDDLKNFRFDSKTKWPNNLPDGFNPKLLMELGKDPGLNIKSLHEKGITGKGIGIAIIDQSLLVNHEEYKHQLMLYHSYSSLNNNISSQHGPAVASIAVGKNIGVAPESKLYFIADDYALYTSNDDSGNRTINLEYYIKDIERLIELNKTLNYNEKIRVISISVGFDNNQKNIDEFNSAVIKARGEGIEILCYGDGNLMNEYSGMGRKLYGNPNLIEDLRPSNLGSLNEEYPLLVPMNNRTLASGSGVSDYDYMPIGGVSWIVPYIAGLYSLSCQVKPDITFRDFTNIARRTGKMVTVSDETGTYSFGLVIDPESIIAELQRK